MAVIEADVLPHERPSPMADGLQACLPWPTMADGETVGDRIRRHRRAQRMSQEHLAELARVSRGYIADLESNAVKNPKDPQKLRRIADALNVSLRAVGEPLGWWDGEDLPTVDSVAAIKRIIAEEDLDDTVLNGLLFIVDKFVAPELELARRKRPPAPRKARERRPA